MNSRALVFSLMSLFLGLMVLNASVASLSVIQETEKLAGEAAEAQKTFGVFENVQDNITEMLEEIASIKFRVSDSNVSFSEKIPEKEKKSGFDQSLADYKRFALQELNEVDLNINDDIIDLSILQISPFDINYMHSDKPGKGWRKNNEILIVPSSINFKGYSVRVTLENQSFESIQTDFKACSGGCSKSITFDLNVLNANKILQATASHSSLDPQKTSTVTVKTSGTSPKDIVITIGSAGKLSVKNDNSVPVLVEATVLLDANSQQPQVVLPQGLVSAASRVFGYKKTN